jgi:hypothetical protein
MTVRYEIRWDANHPIKGRIDLGHFQIQIPQDMPLGNTFVLRGRGFAITKKGNQKEVEHPLNVLPTLVQVWGGEEPSSLEIKGPEAVVEQEKIVVVVRGPGVGISTNNAGWWMEKISGSISVQQNPAQPAKAIVSGVRAGWVRLKVVVGTHTAEKIIRVKPAIKRLLIGSSLARRTLGV